MLLAEQLYLSARSPQLGQYIICLTIIFFAYYVNNLINILSYIFSDFNYKNDYEFNNLLVIIVEYFQFN